MAKANSTRSTNPTAAGTVPADTAPKHDGKASAEELLRKLEWLNWKRDAPVGTRKAIMAAIKAAAALPEQELVRFAEVLSVPLTNYVMHSTSIPYVGTYAKGIQRRSLKFPHTPHAARTTASTLLNEMGYRWDVIEQQLAHQDRSAVRRACNRATYLEERKVMMQQWADLLDQLKAGNGKVIPLKRNVAA